MRLPNKRIPYLIELILVFLLFYQLFPFFFGTKQTLTVPIKDFNFTLAKTGTFVFFLKIKDCENFFNTFEKSTENWVSISMQKLPL